MTAAAPWWKALATRRRRPKRRRKDISLDITPAVPTGRQLIQSYGGGKFRIGGSVHAGSVLVFTEETRAWDVDDPASIDNNVLTPIFTAVPDGGLLVIGCGPVFLPPPKDLRPTLKAQGFVLEWMDTGAACRTFNVLLGEERAAVAALLAVD